MFPYVDEVFIPFTLHILWKSLVETLDWERSMESQLPLKSSLSKNGKKENVPTSDVHNWTCIGVKIKKKKYQDVVVIRIYNFAQETKLIEF